MPVRFIKTSMVGFFITALQHCCSLGTPVVLFIFSSPDPVSTIGRGPAPCPSSCRMGLSEEYLKLCRESFLPQDSVNFPLKMWVSDKQLLFCFFFPSTNIGRIVCFPTQQCNFSSRGARLTLWRKEAKLHVKLQPVHLS